MKVLAQSLITRVFSDGTTVRVRHYQHLGPGRNQERTVEVPMAVWRRYQRKARRLNPTAHIRSVRMIAGKMLAEQA